MKATQEKSIPEIMREMYDDVEKLWADWLVFKKGGQQ